MNIKNILILFMVNILTYSNAFITFYIKMSKKIVVWLVFIVSIFSFVLAQSGNETIENTSVETVPLVETPEKSVNYDYINDIEFRFCNKWVESSLLTERDLVTIDDWDDKKLCLVFFNRWNQPLSIYYGYWSAEIAPNNGMPMCGGDLGVWNFASMIAISDNDTLTIPAGGNIVKYDKLFLPPGIGSWIHHWCINFGLKKDTVKDSTTMFAVQTRKAAGLDILVNGVASLKNAVSLNNQTGSVVVTNKKIKVLVNDDGKATISLLVKNEGNVDQKISMDGQISNFLWYQNKFAVEPQTLGAYGTLEIKHTIDFLPVYKGLFDIKININNTPSFNIDTSSLPQELIQGANMSETAKVFIFSWWFVGGAIVAIFILIKLISSFIKKAPVSPIAQPTV